MDFTNINGGFSTTSQTTPVQQPVQQAVAQQMPQQAPQQPSQQRAVAEQPRYNYETGTLDVGETYYETVSEQQPVMENVGQDVNWEVPQEYSEQQPIQTPVQQSVQTQAQAPVQFQMPQQQTVQQPAQQPGQAQQQPRNAFNSNNNYYPQDFGANNGYGSNQQQYSQQAQNSFQKATYRVEPDCYPLKAVNNVIQKGQAMEVLLDGMNLFNQEEKIENGQRVKGRRISYDSKFHINFWTFDQNEHRMDFLPIYGDMSKLAGIMQCVLNGHIFQMTNAARAKQQQTGSQFCEEIWKSEGGTKKSQNYTINRQNLRPDMCLATRLQLTPANMPDTWLLTGIVYNGKYGNNGSIFPASMQALKRINIKFNYVELCSLATYILNSIQADMNAVAIQRVLEGGVK